MPWFKRQSNNQVRVYDADGNLRSVSRAAAETMGWVPVTPDDSAQVEAFCDFCGEPMTATGGAWACDHCRATRPA